MPGKAALFLDAGYLDNVLALNGRVRIEEVPPRLSDSRSSSASRRKTTPQSTARARA
jgi:hypothetical protein